MRRKILLTVLIFFVILILLLVGAFFFTQTEQFREFARKTTEGIVTSTTGQQFTIGSLEGNFFYNLRLKDVSFKVEGESFVTLDEISVDYSIPKMLDGSFLFSKIVPVEDIIIEGLDVNLIKFEDGTWIFEKIGKSEEKEEKKKDEEKGFPDWSIMLAQFLLKNGEIKIDDRESGKLSSFIIPEIDLSVNLIDIFREIDLNVKNADVTATNPDLRVEGLSVKALYSQDKAEIDNLSVVFNGSEIKLNASGSSLETSPQFSFDAEVLNYTLENLGKVSVKTKGSGLYKNKNDLNAEVSIEIPESELLGRKLEGGIQEIKITGSTLEISGGEIRSDLGEMLIGGGGNLERIITKEGANEFELDIELKDIQTNEIFTILKEQNEREPEGINTELGAILNSKLKARANWAEFSDIIVKGDIESLEIKGEQAGDLKLSGTVEYTKTLLGLDMETTLNKVDLSEILANDNLESQLTSELTVKAQVPLEGDVLPNLSAEVKGDIEPSSIFGLDIQKGDLDVSMANEFIDVRALSITSEDFNLTAKGNQVGSEGVDFSYDLDVKDLGFVSTFAKGTDFSGSLKATGVVKGKITSPEVSIDLLSENLTIKDGTAAESLSLKGNGIIDLQNPDLNAVLTAKKIIINDRPVESAEIKAESENQTIKVNAEVVEDEEFNFEIDTILSGLSEDEKKIEITDLKLNINESKLDNRDSIGITIAPDQLIVENFNMYYNESSAIVNANLNFDGNINARAALNNLSLDNITTALGFENPVAGTLTANINADGTMENPQLNADIKTEGFSYEEFKNDLSFNLSYLGRNLNLKFLITDGSATVLDATGSANVDLNFKKLGDNLKQGTFNLSIDSNGVNLSPVASLVGELDKSEGTLTVDLNASGNLANPKVTGNLGLKEATFKIKSLRNDFIFNDALIEMNGTKGSFNDLTITSGEGTGVFKGEINVSPLSYKINGILDKFTVKPERILAVLSGDLDVKGEGDKIEVAGDITVNRSRITIPDQKEKHIEEIKFVDEEEEEEIVIGSGDKTDFFQENIGLKLDVKMRNNNWVRGQGANVELRGDLSINKKLGDTIRIVGDIRTVRGTYENFGKLFRIEEGNVGFAGGTEINPFLDITALYTVSDNKIYINIGGRAQSPEIKLSSDPAMTETDIVSFLLFGVSSSDLGSNERQSAQNLATGIAGGIAAQQLAQLLGPAISLDVVSIDSNQVEVGKYLTQDLYIAYRRATSESILDSTNITYNKVLVEYQIFKNITIDGDIGGENPGADLFYNFNY